MAKLNFSPPWVTFYQGINALFKEDPDIKVIYDEENLEIKLYVEDEYKATALSLLLPAIKMFGKVKLKITVIPANIDFTIPTFEEGKIPSLSELYEDLFDGNPIVSFIHHVSEVYYPEMTFVVFKKEVAQYFTDNLGDLYGIRSVLYQDIAKETFERTTGIFFCTDIKDTEGILNTPLGEWP